VLSYLNTGNATAEQETIIIKFAPMGGDFANDGLARVLIDSDPDRVTMSKDAAAVVVRLYPNLTDDSATSAVSTTTPLVNTSYVTTGVAYGATADINSEIYVNGITEGHSHTNYTQPDMAGTSFYIGSRYTSIQQLNGLIQKVAIFNRALSASEILEVSNLL
jgi:hypothetical protein